MRILVTGATGNVGRHLVTQLHEAGTRSVPSPATPQTPGSHPEPKRSQAT